MPGQDRDRVRGREGNPTQHSSNPCSVIAPISHRECSPLCKAAPLSKGLSRSRRSPGILIFQGGNVPAPQFLTFQGVNVPAPRVLGVFLQVLLGPGGLREELIFDQLSGEKEGEVTARKWGAGGTKTS